MKFHKIAGYLFMLLIAVVSVQAYGGGGGLIYVTPTIQSNGNTLQHIVFYDTLELTFECSGKNRLVHHDGITEMYEICDPNMVVIKLEADFPKESRGFIDIYTIPADNYPESIQPIDNPFYVLKIETRLEFNDMYIWMKLPIGDYEFYHLIEGEWIGESFSLVREQGRFGIYRANFDSLSYFAIVHAEQPIVVINTAEPDPTGPANIAQPDVAPPVINTPPVIRVPITDSQNNPVPDVLLILWMGLVLAIVGIVMAMHIYGMMGGSRHGG